MLGIRHGTREGVAMNLRVLLFVCLSGVAVLPVFTLGGWIFTDALDREIKDVEDKHLVLARNVGNAVERYTVDLRNGFDFVSALPPAAARSPDLSTYLETLHFVHFCFADMRTGAVLREVSHGGPPCPETVPAARFTAFKGMLKPGETVFSPIMKNPAGRPVFYLLRARGDVLAIGAVRTTYIVQQGKTVSFGKLGHAAIVDHTGQVIAHPLDSWQDDHRDLSGLETVRRMLAGETGTAQFFSPALKADMVTGFTGIPTPGWGIMVPQPLSELRGQAERVQLLAALVGGLGMLVAAAVAWILAGSLARALNVMVETSKRMTDGDLDARIELGRGWKPREVTEVADTFNRMAETMSTSNRELMEALAEADAAARAKSKFLAVTSHELRTPLNAILGFSEIMTGQLHGPINRKYVECADDIHDAGSYLKSLIEDILLIAKTGSDRQLEEDVMAVSDLFRTMDRINRGAADDKGIDFLVHVPDPDVLMIGDERQVRQVLINLVGNAIKFTEPGGKVDLAVFLDAQGAVFAISDTGPGIAPEHMDSIWAPFHQIGDPMVRKHDGAGLGLSIVKTIMDAHDGEVEMESEVGIGSTFRVRFPLSRIVTRDDKTGFRQAAGA